MYKCSECGQLTEELPTYTEYHPYGEGTAPEEMTDWDCSCGGEYEEAEMCTECGEYYPKDFNEYICPDCAMEAESAKDDFLRSLSLPHRQFLTERYGL